MPFRNGLLDAMRFLSILVKVHLSIYFDINHFTKFGTFKVYLEHWLDINHSTSSPFSDVYGFHFHFVANSRKITIERHCALGIVREIPEIPRILLPLLIFFCNVRCAGLGWLLAFHYCGFSRIIAQSRKHCGWKLRRRISLRYSKNESRTKGCQLIVGEYIGSHWSACQQINKGTNRKYWLEHWFYETAYGYIAWILHRRGILFLKHFCYIIFGNVQH